MHPVLAPGSPLDKPRKKTRPCCCPSTQQMRAQSPMAPCEPGHLVLHRWVSPAGGYAHPPPLHPTRPSLHATMQSRRGAVFPSPPQSRSSHVAGSPLTIDVSTKKSTQGLQSLYILADTAPAPYATKVLGV